MGRAATGLRPHAGANDEQVLLAEAQLLLSEKRTSLSAIRTGIALFALPLTVVSALIATSRLYDPGAVLHFLIPVVALCVLLVLLATYVMARAVRRLHRYDALLERLRARDERLAEMLE